MLSVEPDQLVVGFAKRPGERLGAELLAAPPRGYGAYETGRSKKHHQVHDVWRIGDRQRPVRQDEEIVDADKADCRGDQSRPEAKNGPQDSYQSQVQEYVVALLLTPQGEEKGGKRCGGAQGAQPNQKIELASPR